METKFVRVPFDIEKAKKIQNGEYDAKIVTRNGESVRILCWDYISPSGEFPVLALVKYGEYEKPEYYTADGSYRTNRESEEDLFIEEKREPELKIGEEFQLGINTLKVINSNKGCNGCFLNYICDALGQCRDLVGHCCKDYREDKTNVIFIKTE